MSNESDTPTIATTITVANGFNSNVNSSSSNGNILDTCSKYLELLQVPGILKSFKPCAGQPRTRSSLTDSLLIR